MVVFYFCVGGENNRCVYPSLVLLWDHYGSTLYFFEKGNTLLVPLSVSELNIT